MNTETNFEFNVKGVFKASIAAGAGIVIGKTLGEAVNCLIAKIGSKTLKRLGNDNNDVATDAGEKPTISCDKKSENG